MLARESLAWGARVLVAAPAALQGASFRQLRAAAVAGRSLRVLTAHKAFAVPVDDGAAWQVPDAIPHVLVVVDEVSQLTAK
eukprot:11448898-Alexandrium_andersonii.AAC.1